MRIAVVHSFYSSSVPSGENSVVVAQLSALQDAGHDVMLIARRTDDLEKEKLYKIKSALSAAHLVGPSPEGALNDFGPDIVHVHNLFPNWGTSWLKDWSTKTIATVHNYRPICSAGVLWRAGGDCTECIDMGSQRAIVHACYRNSRLSTLPLAWASRSAGRHAPMIQHPARLITLNSNATETYGRLLPGKLIHEIPNFADESHPASLQVGSYWVYVGRLTEEKGIPWLLRNWPRDQRLRIVGTGSMASSVSRYAKSEPNVFTFLGQMPGDEVRKQLAGAQGIVIPSLWSEGIPTVALEALQQGTPVLISEKCASAAVLTAHESGAVFAVSDDGESLAAGVESIDLRGSAIRVSAAESYRRNFSKATWLQKIEDVYASMVYGGVSE